MTWLMLDDGFHWDSAVAALRNDAYRLNIGGMSVCCAHATGQVLPRARFAQAAEGVRRPRIALAELVSSGLWREVEDGWWIRFDGLARLPNREQAKAAAQASVKARQAKREAEEAGADGQAPLEEGSTTVERPLERPLNGRSTVRVRAGAGARGRAGIPIPEPVVTEEEQQRAVENPSPVENSGPLPPGVVARARLLEGLAEEILIRPLMAFERDLVLGWAQIRRAGGFVSIEELAEGCRREMAKPAGNGMPASNLKWADAGVRALARQPLDHQVVRPRAPARLGRTRDAERTVATVASALRDLGMEPAELQALPGGAA